LWSKAIRKDELNDINMTDLLHLLRASEAYQAQSKGTSNEPRK